MSQFIWETFMPDTQPEDRWDAFTPEEQYAIMGAIRVLVYYHTERMDKLPRDVKLAIFRISGELNDRVPVTL